MVAVSVAVANRQWRWQWQWQCQVATIACVVIVAVAAAVAAKAIATMMRKLQMRCSNMQTQLQTLQQHFGYNDFRPGQREVVEALLEGRDCLAVLPTGAGKSLCY